VRLVGAAHRRLDICEALRSRSPRGDVEYLGDEVGQHDASRRCQLRDAQTGLTSAARDVEVLLIVGDTEAFDHRRTDRTQLVHDDRVPLVPAR